MIRPHIMGIVNASSDSFSGNSVVPSDAGDLAARMVASGASVIDIGAQSLRTDRSEITVEEEAELLLPVLRAVRQAVPDTSISVDTYRWEVMQAAFEAGADIGNDPSGLLDDRVAGLVASSGKSLVLTYNRARPKVRLQPGELVDDVVADCVTFAGERLATLERAGVAAEQVIFDPGVDLGKVPAQSVALLQAMPRLRTSLGLDRILWAVSRKDFVGAVLGRTPSGRSAGTLGALAAIDLQPQDLVRVHEVGLVADFLRVRQAIVDGVDADLELPVHLRHDPAPAPDEPTDG